MAIRFPDIPRAALDRKADAVPTVLADGDRFLVPAGKQVLYAQPIQLEGDAVIQIDGALIEVD
jgi:hypothetical protein